MKRKLLLASIAALFAGIGAGYLAGSQQRASFSSPPASLPVPPGSAQSSTVAANPAPDLPLPANALMPALERLREERDEHRQLCALDELCASLDAHSARALLEKFRRRPGDDSFDSIIMQGLIGRWAEIDPRAAADFAARMKNDRRGSALYGAVAAWAERDGPAALEWAMSQADRVTRMCAVADILSVLTARDTDVALRFISELPRGENKELHTLLFFGRLAAKNVGQATALAARLSSTDGRNAALREVAQVWAQTDPARALTWFFQNSTSHEDWMMNGVFHEWVSTAPEDAAGFAAALPPGSARTAVVQNLGTEWGAVDPEAAAQWLRSLPRGAESANAFKGLIRSWTHEQPQRAAEFLLAQTGDRLRDDLLHTLGADWAEQDPAAALAWARTRNEPELEYLIVAPAVAAVAARDPTTAERRVAELKTPKAQTAAIVEIANGMTQRSDPAAAAKWLMDLDSKYAIGTSFHDPMREWARRDRDAAGAWLNEQPAGARKDAALDRYADGLAERDAASAAAWAATIGDGKLRQKRLQAVVTAWADSASAAARAWVAGQHFSAAEQSELLREAARK